MPARILSQNAWRLKAGWDTTLPDCIYNPWKGWVEEMPLITEHPIPRPFGLRGKTVHHREIHGFSDASEQGFGGVVFLRTFCTDLDVAIDNVTSKARVAPLKILTIPRLELSGAVVVAQVLHEVAIDLKIPPSAVYAWTDSTIVLSWLNHSPSKLAVFVGNRVAKATQWVPPAHWRHVRGKENPADCLSRGMSPKALLTHDLWWKGPEWLSLEPAHWPKQPNATSPADLPELRKSVMTVQAVAPELGEKHSQFTKWIRIVAWILRFRNNASKSSNKSASSSLSLAELARAKSKVFLVSQLYSYPDKYKLLSQGKALPARHPLLHLTPFVDADGLLRVGGRLQQADLPESTIHPLILSPRSHTVKLLVENTHRTMSHAGSSAVMATLAYTYHIPRLRPLLRSISSKCVECQRRFARPAKQMMGDLPAIRSKPNSTFASVGVDYAGPVFIKKGRGRNFTRIKTYLALFICMTTKAIHIEVVADATTASFLAALDRSPVDVAHPPEYSQTMRVILLGQKQNFED